MTKKRDLNAYLSSMTNIPITRCAPTGFEREPYDASADIHYSTPLSPSLSDQELNLGEEMQELDTVIQGAME